MGHVVIGTAGHIDHGKTTLIKALTGIETDRLKEEIKRGITIDLGFAWFDLPGGRRAGIVDVPGHERFIKNMLAGVSGIDIVLLIVSADEGVMPQTREHLDILSLLHIQKGIVVVTKSDLVEPEWLDLVQEEIRDALKDTFMATAPIVPVSAVTRAGLDNLTALIDHMTQETTERNTAAPFRFPVDRVFSVTGFGTVVTGTLTEGIIREGQEAILYPRGQETRIRKIQVHGENTDVAYAGQRVALNVANLKKTDISRGDVLAAPGSLRETWMIDAQIELLLHEHRTLENWTRLRLYHGTREILCRMVLLDRESIEPGDTAVVQLRLEEPMACRYMDRFVLRFYSPLETIGGGVVLDPHPAKHKRFKDEILKELEQKLSGDEGQILESTLLKLSPTLPDAKELQTRSGLETLNFNEELGKLLEQGIALRIEDVLIHRDFMDNLAQEIAVILENWHKKYPLRPGMPKEEVRSRLLKQAKSRLFDSFLKRLESEGILKVLEKDLALAAYSVTLPEEAQRLLNRIEAIYHEAGYTSPTLEEAFESAGAKAVDPEIVNYLVSMGTLISFGEALYYHRDSYEALKTLIMDHLKETGAITVGDLRDLAGTSRKYAIPMLEHMDALRITQRDGDKRILR